MDNTTYHHGDLKNTLIHMGLKLLNEKGIEGFSLRKVAAMCNVSHAAPYKHFENKEELISAISAHVSSEFTSSLKEIAEKHEEDPYRQIIEMGKKYVGFMVENPDYLKFFFLNNDKNGIKADEYGLEECKGGPFQVFRTSAINFLKSIGVKEENYTDNAIAMWAMVHGITVMLVNKTLIYEGDYIQLVERLLYQNLKFKV